MLLIDFCFNLRLGRERSVSERQDQQAARPPSLIGMDWRLETGVWTLLKLISLEGEYLLREGNGWERREITESDSFQFRSIRVGCCDLRSLACLVCLRGCLIAFLLSCS